MPTKCYGMPPAPGAVDTMLIKICKFSPLRKFTLKILFIVICGLIQIWVENLCPHICCITLGNSPNQSKSYFLSYKMYVITFTLY